MRARTRLVGVVLAAGLLPMAPAAAQACGFACTVSNYLDLPDEGRDKFIESHAKTSRNSRNAAVKKCVSELSDEQIRVIFETYIEKRPRTLANRATNVYAIAIAECDTSRLDAPLPAEEPPATETLQEAPADKAEGGDTPRQSTPLPPDDDP